MDREGRGWRQRWDLDGCGEDWGASAADPNSRVLARALVDYGDFDWIENRGVWEVELAARERPRMVDGGGGVADALGSAIVSSRATATRRCAIMVLEAGT